MTLKCPHCTVTVHIQTKTFSITEAVTATKTPIFWEAVHEICPNCKQAVIWLVTRSVKAFPNGVRQAGEVLTNVLVWPQNSERPIPAEVPSEIGRDFTEAVRVLPLSAQSSAALTRRLLQQILKDHAGTTKRDLFDQIQEVLDKGNLPTSLADQLHAVRAIGNFAAHPLKSQNTGQIVPVEPNEAEWNLDVLEDVFDYYFVKPAKAQARIAALNVKLAEVGKPQLP